MPDPGNGDWTGFTRDVTVRTPFAALIGLSIGLLAGFLAYFPFLVLVEVTWTHTTFIQHLGQVTATMTAIAIGVGVYWAAVFHLTGHNADPLIKKYGTTPEYEDHAHGDPNA